MRQHRSGWPSVRKERGCSDQSIGDRDEDTVADSY
jgi:hypothetical protein